ncbi:M24 family metallopeptidase [Leptolinea tardivitalis]|uniref:M24 family metallopeptidase n=1 Tax=Leptolinea tardivitalis TaxID=229920 RepID=UPI0007832E95|nr:M24 family metallopeptidase [Leptolinea tardivitalis]GAP21111.1 Xaa-Pro aminopeptidase [Leptolinea tardivitalis]
MKNELEQLMKSNGIAAILITGAADHNPAMTYFTGHVHVSHGDLVIKPGEKPILFHDPMEREEAAKTGCVLKSYLNHPYAELVKETNGDKSKMDARKFAHVLEDCGVTSGKVVLYGQSDAGKAYSAIKGVIEYLPDVEFQADWDENLLYKAMTTKDENELNQIRDMGRVTTDVVGRVADFLSQQKSKGNQLVKKSGEPVTIGEVKNMINLWLAEGGAENPEATIFSLGRDAGIPHSTGTNSEGLRLGETIVFDIFPCQFGGGFFYDFTRTWCLGYAPDNVVKLYDDVKKVYDTVVSELKPNTLCNSYQKRTCELYENMGHPTMRTHKNTEVGYNHSIGHGVGLRIHEKPWFGDKADETDVLKPGSVFTIEPGLYYPDKGMGVRIEDTYCVNHKNQIELMAEYPYDLVLPIRS